MLLAEEMFYQIFTNTSLYVLDAEIKKQKEVCVSVLCHRNKKWLKILQLSYNFFRGIIYNALDFHMTTIRYSTYLRSGYFMIKLILIIIQVQVVTNLCFVPILPLYAHKHHHHHYWIISLRNQKFYHIS